VTDLREQLPITNPFDVHAILRHLREDAGLTRIALARAAGCNQQQIDDWETAAKRPNLDSLHRVAAALGYRIALIPREPR